MNIIQLQDDLKNLPDQVLVNYAQNPTGTMQGIAGYAPSYLVLAELQRRKDMRERYQADKQPEPSVAEQLIEEAKAQGLASMLPQGMPMPEQGVGAPQPQPEMTPDMLAQKGVGSLPAPNVGKNYAGGGIVAFADGGMASDMVEVDPNLYFPYDSKVSSVFGMPEEPSIKDYKDESDLLKEQFGVDPKFYENEREALKTQREAFEADKKDALNMRLIEAGLGIAGGTSQNALENVAKGGVPALQGYTADIKDAKKEQRLLEKEDRALDRMARAEAMGDVKGYKEYSKEIRATQLKLIEINLDNAAKMAAAAAASGTAQGKAMSEAIKYSIDELAKRYPDGANLPFADNPEGWEKERKKIQEQRYEEILSGKVSKDVIPISGYSKTDTGSKGDSKKVVRTVTQNGVTFKIFDDGSQEVVR